MLATWEFGRTAYFIAFGPHGPRTPLGGSGTWLKVTGSVLGAMAVAGLIVASIRSTGPFSFLPSSSFSPRDLPAAIPPLVMDHLDCTD